jgi:hypothetical protein
MTLPALALALATLAAPAAGSVPPEIEAAHAAAEASARAGDYRAAARGLREVVAALETLPADEAPPEEWTRALLRLAVLESTIGNGPAARAAVERALSIDPAVALDPETWSPAFRRELEAARVRVAARPRLVLRVTSRDGTGTAWVQGRALGPVPVEARLPEGSYRVAVGPPGALRTVTVNLTRDETVIVDAVSTSDLATVAPPQAEAPLAVQAPAPAGWMRPAGWTAAGLSAVAAGIATWQGVAAGRSYADAKAMLLPDGSLAPGVDPAAYTQAASAFATERRNAWIAGGSAVVLGAGAAALLLLAPAAPVEPSPGGIALRF